MSDPNEANDKGMMMTTATRKPSFHETMLTAKRLAASTAWHRAAERVAVTTAAWQVASMNLTAVNMNVTSDDSLIELIDAERSARATDEEARAALDAARANVNRAETTWQKYFA